MNNKTELWTIFWPCCFHRPRQRADSMSRDWHSIERRMLQVAGILIPESNGQRSQAAERIRMQRRIEWYNLWRENRKVIITRSMIHVGSTDRQVLTSSVIEHLLRPMTSATFSIQIRWPMNMRRGANGPHILRERERLRLKSYIWARQTHPRRSRPCWSAMLCPEHDACCVSYLSCITELAWVVDVSTSDRSRDFRPAIVASRPATDPFQLFSGSGKCL